jgi:hypothetical protein
MMELHIHSRKMSSEVLEHIFRPLNVLFITEKRRRCADNRIRQWYPVICACTADYRKYIHLHSINQPHCPVCEVQKLAFGESNLLRWRLRYYQLYHQNMTMMTQGEDTE